MIALAENNEKTMLTEEEVNQTLEVMMEALKSEKFDINQFSKSYYQGAATPMMQNELMKRINIDTVAPTKSKIEEALNAPGANEDNLISFNQSLYFSSFMYKRNLEYMASLPSFDLEMTCINAEAKDYSTSKYKNDYKIVADFLDKFDYRKEFKDITWHLLMSESYFGMYRDLGNKSTFQDWPLKYAQISGKWEYGLLYDVDMSWFLQPQVDINCYPDWCKKKYLEMFKDGKLKEYKPSNKINKRTGAFGVWAQTDPADGFWCFKWNHKHNLQVPFFTAMLPEMAIIPLMRNLQVNQSMAAARKLLVSEIPYLSEKKSSSVANSLAINPDVLGKFLGLATQGLEAAIKVLALPTEDIKGVEFENTDKETYKNFMAITSSLLSGGKVIFSSDENQNVAETNLSLNLDELLSQSIYPQFADFLNYMINKKTKKYKWRFRFVGCNDATDRERRQEEAFKYADKGVVLPNKIASSLGLNKIELERELEEAKNTGFTDKLMMMMNINTMSNNGGRPSTSSGDNEAGRPQEDESKLTVSGAESRASGSNIEKGGSI